MSWRSGPDASGDVADNAVLRDPLAARTSPRNGHCGGVPVHCDVVRHGRHPHHDSQSSSGKGIKSRSVFYAKMDK
jgi:hypothetical protein